MSKSVQGVAVAALVVVGGWVSFASAVDKPDVAVLAKQLAFDYATNERAADDKYIGKVIRVKGEVIETGLSEDNVVYADLRGVKTVKVRCFFPGVLEEKVKAIKKGTKMVFQGKNNAGLWEGAVGIDSCEFVE